VTHSQKGESWSRGLPASCVMIVRETSTVCRRSQITRRDSGTSFDLLRPRRQPRLLHRPDLFRNGGRAAARFPRNRSRSSARSASRRVRRHRERCAITCLLMSAVSSVAWMTVLLRDGRQALSVATDAEDHIRVLKRTVLGSLPPAAAWARERFPGGS
jgi:hypothetical protein